MRMVFHCLFCWWGISELHPETKNQKDLQFYMVATFTEPGQHGELAFQHPDIPLAILDERFRGCIPGHFFLLLAMGASLFALVAGYLQFKHRPMIASIAFVSKQHRILLLDDRISDRQAELRLGRLSAVQPI
jgi:hypothetical protein